jgi:glycosyltransferase involved in cell wall biosynthesis
MSIHTQTPSVSVVITAYEHAQYIREAVNSVVAQTLKPLEIIVIDDGSPDDTGAVLEPLIRAGAIRYLRQENRGQAAARNRGAALASGRYLAFLDDDDAWLPDALEWRVAELEADPGLTVVFGDCVDFDAPTQNGASGATHPASARRVEWLNLFSACPMVSPGQAVIRRDAFEAAGGFDTSIWGADDWDLWFRMLRVRPARHLGRATLRYRSHASNASRHAARLCRNMVAVLERHLEDVPDEHRTLIRGLSMDTLLPWWRRHIRRAVRAACDRGDWRAAIASTITLASVSLRTFRSRVLLKVWLMARNRWTADGSHPMVRAFQGETPIAPSVAQPPAAPALAEPS